jgi:hypothetical protein
MERARANPLQGLSLFWIQVNRSSNTHTMSSPHSMDVL